MLDLPRRSVVPDLVARPARPVGRLLDKVTRPFGLAELADRILVLSSNPGRIRAELAVAMPRPRDRHDPGFEQLVDTVYGILTGREDAAERAAAAVGEAPPGHPPPPRPTCRCRRSRPAG